MKLSEPIGSELWAPVLVRVTLGAWLVAAGLAVLDDLPGFINQVVQLGILPSHIATVYAILLPYIEITTGILLILGIWTTLAAMLSAVIFLSFIVAFGISSGRGYLFTKDVLLLAAALSLMYSGAGAMSIDRFRRGG